MRITPTLPAVQAVLQEGRLGAIGDPVGTRSAVGQRAIEGVKTMGGMDADRDGSEPPPDFLSEKRKSAKKQTNEKTATSPSGESPGPRLKAVSSAGPADGTTEKKASKFDRIRTLALRQLGTKEETTPAHKKKSLEVARAYSQNQSQEAESNGQQIDRYV